MKIKETKITVIPIYSDIETHNISHKDHKDFIFLTVSRLVPVKNISLQIEAMKEIVKKNSIAELWIVGDGPEKTRLEKMIADYGLTKNIRLLGWQTDLTKYYSGADAFLLTSSQEGWGLVVIEAASFGLPIIMTDVGCAGEVIKDNESGIVIPVGDADKLTEAMASLINNKEMKERLRNGALEALKVLPSKEETLRLYKESWQKALL